MSTLHRDLTEQANMLRDAIAEGSPLAALLQKKLTEIEAQLGLTAKLPDQQSETADEATDGSQRRRPQGGAPAANQYGKSTVRYASDKQVKFIKTLLDRKDLTHVNDGVLRVPTTAAEAETVNAKHASAVIDKLLAAPDKIVSKNHTGHTMTSPGGATLKQLNLIKKLLGEREIDPSIAPYRASEVDGLSMAEASQFISYLFSCPKTARPVTTVELAVGIYEVDEKIYKVYPNQTKTRLLAKLLVLPEGWVEMSKDEREVYVAEHGDKFWTYAGMADRFVKPEHKMSKEAAEKFGQITSVCCQCGRMLTLESSIEQGMGDWCAKNGELVMASVVRKSETTVVVLDEGERQKLVMLLHLTVGSGEIAIKDYLKYPEIEPLLLLLHGLIE